MKTGGIILCGGSGTRLLPTTSYLNKHLMPIYDKPMIYYSLSIIFLSGIRNITLVCNTNQLNMFRDLLGNGEEFGVEITYSTQDEPEGIPHAINNALNTKPYSKFLTVLGDNFIFGEKFFTRLEKIFNSTETCSIFSQNVKNPENFGVIQLNEKNEIQKIVEKPKEYLSSKAVIGLYIFNSDFQNKFLEINKSDRNEFEITDLIMCYDNKQILHNPVGRGTAWFDMGTMEDFYISSSFVRTIQERQGLLVCSPHEIAYRNGWISKSELFNYINKIEGSEYSYNLKNSLN
jgi:glucose-1-phosphate thymidylyltransferase